MSRASTWVSGLASTRPDVSSTRARDPVSITTVSPRSVRVPPALSATSIVFGATKRPLPMTSSAPLSRYFSRWIATSPSTIIRLRSRTAAMSTFGSPTAIPNSALLRK